MLPSFSNFKTQHGWQCWYCGILLAILVGAVLASFHRTFTTQPTAEFGGVTLQIEYATTTEARERGLSGRMSVPGDYGMLFVFEKDDQYGFWMKDMEVPIDIFWLDAQKRVVSSALEVATSTFPTVFYPNIPARYVLETEAGFGRAHGIATGTPLLLKNF
jgi:hypothetical protein